MGLSTGPGEIGVDAHGAADRTTDVVTSAGTIDVFLCHNSRDKALVRQVAEGLELEFGIPHFLDAYAIPTGEAFLPWIDKALATSSGCAIFLGAQGWGETHFWEAERALDRYRKDPRFRLIPVSLPGIREEDMARLGSGSVFSQLNWADFRSGPVDAEAIRKLRAALLGQAPERGRGPARLTPYLVRRDAVRWEESGRKDRSILYRGRQLIEAEKLRAAQPDLVAGDAIVAFLSASARHQTRRALWLAGLAASAAVAIAILGVNAELSRRLAFSRFIAAEARQAASPDTGLLLALQATTISDTPEAFGALLERLDTQPYLRNIVRVGATEPLSLIFSADATRLYAGLADGRVALTDLRTMKTIQAAWQLPASVTALCVDSELSQLWAGTQDGRVFVLESGGVTREIIGFELSPRSAAKGDTTATGRFPILSLQVDPQRRWLAVGDHNHRLRILDRETGRLLWTRSMEAQRVTSVSFSADGALLAAASSEGLVDVFDARSGEPAWTTSTARTGNPLAVQFARNGDLRVIDDGLLYSVFASGGAPAATKDIAGGDAVSAAAVGPKREFGPTARRDLFVAGFDTGDVSLTPITSDVEPVRIRAHARAVDSAALADDGRFAATGSSDGVIAVWDLQQRSRLLTRGPGPDGEVIALGYKRDGRLLAVTSSDETAALAIRSKEGWRSETDLAQLSAALAGQVAIDKPPASPDAQGFVALPDALLTHAALSAGADYAAWATRGGALIWSPLPVGKRAIVLNAGDARVEALALSNSGRFIFAAAADGRLMRMDSEHPSLPPILHHMPAPIRQLVASNSETGIEVALDDASLRRVDFASGAASEVSRLPLSGAAGQLSRLPGEDLFVVAGAGSSAGVDVGIVEDGAYRRLHSRRVGGAVAAVASSRSSGIIAAADHIGNLHLWDLATLVPMASVHVLDGALNGAAISVDARRLALSSVDGSIFELALPRDEWRRVACDIVQRELTIGEWSALVPERAPKEACVDSLRKGSSRHE